MKPTRLSLVPQGIQRNKPEGQSEDGNLQEMINMRPRDGAWRVVGPKPQTETFAAGVQYHFMHQISPTRKAWWVTNTTGKAVGYYIVDNDLLPIDDDLTFDTYSASQAQVSFVSLGNVVIMIDSSSQVQKAYLFEPDNDAYRLVGDLLPDLVHATILESSAATYTDSLELVNNTEWSKDAADALIIKTVAELREDGYWFNKLYFRYAYELYDGSIVKHSPPIRINGGYFDTWSKPINTGATWTSDLYCYDANFRINDTSALAALKANYKGLIKGINIYCSRPSEKFETEDVAPTIDAATATIEHTDPKLDEVNNFYLVKKLSLDELANTTDVSIFDEEDLSELTTNYGMPVDNLTNHTLFSDNPFNYNQRIFWSGIKNTLFSGFDPRTFNPYPAAASTGGDQTSLYCEVTIETGQGEKKVVSSIGGFYYYQNLNGFLACFAYPDSRASKLKIIVRNHIAGTYKYKDEVALTPHKHYNFAFVEDVEWDDTTTTALSTEVKTYWDYNRVQASELNNPFYFPAINSYRIGQGAIVGLSANAIAISTGQFGQYPMYAFTTDGLWTLQIGSGDVLIESIKPLARHVCTNAQSILSIDGGSTFSTEKGMFIISGEKVIEISQVAEGEYASPVASHASMVSLVALTGVSDYLCDEGFKDYLSDAVIGYDFEENEILVSKSSKDYTWVFNIDNGMWYKRFQVWDSFINAFPKMYGINNTNRDVEDLTVEVITGYRPFYMETRPLLFGTTDLKKIMRILIEMSFKSAILTSVCFQLYGSADGINYDILYDNRQTWVTSLKRLVIGRAAYSCEHFILVSSTIGVYNDGYLGSITLDLTRKFSNKLR